MLEYSRHRKSFPRFAKRKEVCHVDGFSEKLTGIFDFVSEILGYIWDFFKKLQEDLQK